MTLDDPIGARASFEREVLGCFGVMPNFFCSASAAPGLIEELWAFAKSAYIDSPLPSLFKERLFAHLSRFCEVRYCIIRHVGFLIGEGRPAGDPKARPETIEQVITLLQRSLPDANALAEVFARLESHKEARNIPLPETQAEYDLFDALTVMFLEPRRWERAREAVRRAVGSGTFELLTAFLAFVRTAHFWTETHPELSIEPDIFSVLEKNQELARLLLDPSDAECVKAGEALRQTLVKLEDAEAFLRESREQLASIVDSSDDAIISKDLNGIISSWNRGAERLFGYLAKDVIGKSITILIPPERQEEEDATRERLRRGDRIDHYETVRQRKDGSLIDISLTVSLVRGAAREIVGVSMIARDITERKRSEAQFLFSLARPNTEPKTCWRM
jgi:PAS domain S-box-containing protein